MAPDFWAIWTVLSVELSSTTMISSHHFSFSRHSLILPSSFLVRIMEEIMDSFYLILLLLAIKDRPPIKVPSITLMSDVICKIGSQYIELLSLTFL